MWKEGNAPTLFVGMKAGATTLENSVEVPQKTENRATLWTQRLHYWVYILRIQTWCSKGARAPDALAAMSTIAKLC